MRVIKLYTPDEFAKKYGKTKGELKELFEELFEEKWGHHPIVTDSLYIELSDAVKSIEEFVKWAEYQIVDYEIGIGQLNKFKIEPASYLAEAWEYWCEHGEIPFEDEEEWISPVENLEQDLLMLIWGAAKGPKGSSPDSLPTKEDGTPDYEKAVNMAGCPFTGSYFDAILLEEYVKAIVDDYCPRNAIIKAVKKVVNETLVKEEEYLSSFEGFLDADHEVIAVEERGDEESPLIYLMS